MKAAVLHGIGDLRIEEIPAPVLEPGEERCLVRVRYAGICGSDIARVFHDGTYTMPLIPGHEFAGVIEQAGPGSPLPPGRAVAVYPLLPCFECPACSSERYPQCRSYGYFGSRCHGGFAEYVKVPYFNLVAVPQGLPLDLAALCEPASVAQHGLRTAGLYQGDTVLIFGAGAIGLMMAQWAFILGAAEVTLVDVSEEKLRAGREICPQAGFINSRRVRLEERLAGKRFRLCVEGSGAFPCYAAAIAFTADNGRVLLLGNPSSDLLLERSTVSLILRRQLTIYGTWNSTVADSCNEWACTLQAMSDGRLRVGELITHRVPLQELPQALEMMRGGNEFYNRVVVEI